MAKVTPIKSRITNSQLIGSGQQSGGDRTAWQSLPYNSSNPETFTNPIERWRQLYLMYSTSWECRKIVNIPVDDALRKPFILKGISDDAATVLKRKFDRLQLIPTLKRSLKLERLFGGCLTFMGLEADKDDEVQHPYKPQRGEPLHFINSIPISRISRMTWDTNPLSENYMRPSVFFINNQEVHVSRCLLWDGTPLIDPNDFALTNYRANLAGFGSSIMSAVWDDVIMAVGTRQAAYQMAQVNGAIIATIQDLQDLTGTAPGVRNLNKIKDVINQLSTFRAAILDGEKVDVKSFASSFGSVPELLMAYLQVLSAASDIPATRFLGQAPGGLNATGDSDLENYYNMLDAMQHERISPQLLRLCDVIGYAEVPGWAAERNKLEIEWPPLWNETAKEQAERSNLTVDYVLKLVENSLMGDEQAIEEINARGILSVKLDADDLALLDTVDEPGDDGPATPPNSPERRPTTGEPAPGDAAKQIERLKNMSHFAKGFLVEQEHRASVAADAEPDDDMQLARIAMDHLKEDPQYYEKLGRIENYITEANGKYTVHAESGKKMGAYSSRAEAEKRLREIEYFKHKNATEPTEAQIAAGNYKKTHVRHHGLDIAIENPKGSVRRGRDPQTKKVWECTLPADYGYIKRTEGADGDHVDVYIGPDPESPVVYVIDQVDLSTGQFDEHKCIIGCSSQDEAVELYLSGFSDGLGHRRLGTMTGVSVDDFKAWLRSGDTTKPFAQEVV